MSTETPGQPHAAGGFVCSIVGCQTKAVAHGWCPSHNWRWKKYGDPEYPSQHRTGCSVADCDRKHVANGLCRMHYRRLYDGNLRLDDPPRYSHKPTSDAERKELKQARTHSYRAQKRNTSTEVFTTSLLLETWGTDCHICKLPIDLDAPRRPQDGDGWEYGLHRDHVIALINGGTDTIENCRPSHAVCNLRKGSK
jgi:HNH endonuclease